MRRTLIGGLALALIVGCRSVPQTPVPLQADAVSIAHLAGNWVGEYWGGMGGRGGSLSFSLRSGTDSLYGEVTMVDPGGQPLRSADPSDAHAQHVRTPHQLRIDFVAARADSIRGVLEPYIAPDCQCAVSTTFFGHLKDGKITGTFQTRNAGRVQAEGSWEMKRVGDAK
jgi:hypothetical protein